MNAFKQLLQQRLRGGGAPGHGHQRVPLGTWVMSASPLVVEAVGCAGFDWVVIDMEHSPVELGGVAQMLQALGTTKAAPIVRVPWNDTVVIKRVLDAGAQTVIVPFVQDAAEARCAAAALRYPPRGVRGVVGTSRANRFGTQRVSLEAANEGVALIVQLESPRALDALEDIAAVDGVDALFVGPADLSAGMGLGGDPTHPDVMKALVRAAARAQALGKPIGTLAGTPEVAAQVRAAGYDFVGIGTDLGWLVRSAQASLAALRSGDAPLVHTLSGGTHSY
ncbi:MAG TPA: aldolase/citrate lyase family protein [Methylibium sp.]|nr:aldolase/citrate lyase family protein [Methylibium sp.]